MNRYYGYENIHLWNEEAWEGHKSALLPLVQWLGEHDKPYGGWSGKEDPEPTKLPYYQSKNHAIDDPEVIAYWEKKGLRYRSMEMGLGRWMSMVPVKAFDNREEKLPVLVVMHVEDYSSPYWTLKTLEKYNAYNEMAIKENFILIYLVTNGPDNDRMYNNQLQEALVLYPGDPERTYLDLSLIYDSGLSLGQIKEYTCTDRNWQPVADADAEVERFGELGIPVLNIRGRWENRVSLGRDLIMQDRYSSPSFNREWMLHTQEARQLMEGITLEYKYNDLYDPELLKYWDNMGLHFDSNVTKGERWVVLAPKQALEEPKKKLPLLCCLQEVNWSNEHLALTALSYLYTFNDIAAQGECIALYFVLEDPDSNDLLAEIIEEAAKKYPIDMERVYITGHSHDGHYSTAFARRHPNMIAAVATLGNLSGLPDPKISSEACPTTDADIEHMQNIDMPLINLCGMCEFGNRFPWNADAHDHRPGQERHSPKKAADRVYSWQRRLMACRCPVKTEEEIYATVNSEDTVERTLGFPADRTSVVWIDGLEHYIADIKNIDGNYHLRVVGIQNLSHIPSPSMMKVAWDFIRKFARNRETGEIIELYKTK